MAFEDRFNRSQDPISIGMTFTKALARGNKVLRGNLILTGSVTISGGTTNGTPICEGGAIGLIKQIRLVANKGAGSRYPGGTIVKCRPQSLLRFAITQRGGKFIGEQSGNTLGNGAAGTYNIYLSIPIYFGDALNENSLQTSLNMDPFDSTGKPVYTSVELQVDFVAGITEIFSGSDRVLTFPSLNAQWRDDRLQMASDTIPLVQEDHLAIIQSANSEFVDQSMPNDGAFESWLILQQAGSPGFQLADTLLNKLEIRGSTINFRENRADMVQQMLDDNLWDASTATTGQTFIDFKHGLLRNSNPAPGLQHLIDVNNPSGGGNDRLLIYTRRVFQLAA